MAKAISLQTKKKPQKGSTDDAALLRSGAAHMRKDRYHVIKLLSGQDAVQALIKAGIMTSDGRLAKAYGGKEAKRSAASSRSADQLSGSKSSGASYITSRRHRTVKSPSA